MSPSPSRSGFCSFPFLLSLATAVAGMCPATAGITVNVERAGGGPIANGGTLQVPRVQPASVGETTLTVRNAGPETLTGFTAELSGTNASEFSLTDTPPSTLVPGASATLRLRHSPNSLSPKSAYLELSADASSGLPVTHECEVVVITGTLDAGFTGVSGNDQLWSLAVQADGSIYYGQLNTLTKLCPDGTPDSAFTSPNLAGGTVDCIAALSEGRVLIGGTFASVNGTARPGLARLHANGRLDASFLPVCPPGVSCLAVRRDGKIFIANTQYSVSPPVSWLTRLMPDGAADTSFTAPPHPDGPVNCILPRTDGSALICGWFSLINGASAARLARLEPNGQAHSFGGMNPDTSILLNSLTALPDGRLLAAGFGEPGSRWGIERFQAGGAPVPWTTSGPPPTHVFDMAMLADGTCLTAMMQAGSAIGVMKNAELPLSPFLGDFSAMVSMARRIAVQADGKVLIAGYGNIISPLPETGGPRTLLRLHNDPGFSALRTTGRTAVRWLRGGAVPDVQFAVFERRIGGTGPWTLLGDGTRFDGGWELSGLTLPLRGTVRVQGRAAGSLIESLLPLPLDAWRLTFFGTAENTGSADDDADTDQDGLTNFTEFAFGTSPVDPNSADLPEFHRNGDLYTAAFTSPEGREAVSYRAEHSATLLPDSWTAVPDTGTGNNHVFTIPAAGDRLFVRFVAAEQ